MAGRAWVVPVRGTSKPLAVRHETRSDNASSVDFQRNPRLTCDTRDRRRRDLVPPPDERRRPPPHRPAGASPSPAVRRALRPSNAPLPRMRSSIPRSSAPNTGRSSRPLLYPRLRHDQQDGFGHSRDTMEAPPVVHSVSSVASIPTWWMPRLPGLRPDEPDRRALAAADWRDRRHGAAGASSRA